MPTIYQTCGTAIEKIGPSDGGMSGRGRPIAFCADTNTASILCDALNMLERINKCVAEDELERRLIHTETIYVLRRAGLI